MGQNDGIENETQIVEAYNNKMYKRLRNYQQNFIEDIFGEVKDDAIIHAKKIGGQGFKPDVSLTVENNTVNISVKKGGGNSVHQEKTEYFIQYCMKYLGMTEEERDSLLLFLYGDGTTDGNSLPKERLQDSDLIETYRKEIGIVQDFLNRNKRNLIERFLVYGRLGRERGIKADYLYHGNAIDGVWCQINYEAIDYIATAPNAENSPLSIGPLTIQVWNRNLSGKPEMEERRHSIQVKWRDCKSDVKKINELLSKKREEYEDADTIQNERVIGDNSQGFENQDNIVNSINAKRVNDLTLTFKNMVTTMFPAAAMTDTVYAAKIISKDTKPRISVSINDVTKYLSVSMGSGNSVHQEKLESFLDYCKSELQISQNEIDAIRTIVYGDGSLDGNSKATDRLKNTEEVRSHYPNEVGIAQNFFNNHKKDLIERFLIYGKGGKEKGIKSDYIYYGTDRTGLTLPYDLVIDYLVNKDNSDSALLSLGSLTFQPWNRNPQAKPNLEDRRHSVQVKWGSMKQDLINLNNEINNGNVGTIEGDWEEYELVSRLNRDKRIGQKYWSVLCESLDLENLDKVYAICVSKLVHSKLSGRLVLPKADIYLVRGNIDHQVLLDNNYWLDDDMIENLDVKPIKYSGISCKRPTSKSFTYAKLTINSFIALFSDAALGAGASLFVKEEDIDLNHDILRAWGVSEEDLLQYFSSIVDKDSLADKVRIATAIKNEAIRRIVTRIKSDKNISDVIFFGKGVFDEPYTANFIFSKHILTTTYVPEFTVTTGSGRHKGIYTLVVKPR